MKVNVRKTLLVIGIFTITLIPAIVWLVLGGIFHNDCSDLALDVGLTTWLTVSGSLEVVMVILVTSIAFIGWKDFLSDLSTPITALLAVIAILISIAYLVWEVIGFVILAKESDSDCRNDHPHLYNTVIAATVINFWGALLSSVFTILLDLIDVKEGNMDPQV